MSVGRPEIPIDFDLVDRLGKIMCTRSEIASILGCSESKLAKDEEFMAVYKKALEQGKMSLRRKQYELAMKGNCTMLIWLGRQYLKQTDKLPEDEEAMAEDKTLKVQIIRSTEEDIERLERIKGEVINGDNGSC